MPASPANNGYRPGFAAALMAKDLGLAANALDETGGDALIGSGAAEIYRAFADSLDGEPRDFSAIVESVRERSGRAPEPAPE